MISEKFPATAVLKLRPSNPGMATSEQTMSAFLGAKDPYVTIAQTKSKLFNDRQVAAYVVKKLKLTKRHKKLTTFRRFKRWVKQSFKDAWTILKYGYLRKPGKLEGLVGEVQKSIRAVPIKPTYLIAVTATSPEPKLSASIANSAVDAFIYYQKKSLKNEIDKSLKVIDSQLKKSLHRLEASEQALKDYQQEQKITALPDEISARINAIVQLRIAKAELYSKSLSSKRAIDKEIDSYIQGLSDSPEKQKRIRSLMRDLNANEQDYLTILKNKQATEQAQGWQQSDVQIIEKAKPPLYPSKPIKILYIGVAVFLGLFLSSSYVLLQARLALLSHDSDPEEKSIDRQIIDTIVN
ncbi:MAG TPA: hypothetical protein ENH19_03700 [Actinobacteria bacterium]|nr:hypothetical protein [Actinomycetes bacterium]HEX21736.1 hypothetical protein [Actinomycetota bacterium]